MELLSLYRQEGADAKALLTHAVFWMFQGCGNSDANAYLTEWLEQAKKLGAYNGKTVGKIIDLRDEFNEWLDENGGLPPLDNQQGGAVSAELALLKRKVDYWERRCKAAELFMASHVADPDITSEMARNYREWLHIAQEDQPSIKAHNE